MRREHFLVFLSPLVLIAIGVGYIQVSRQAGTRRGEDVPGEALYRELLGTVRDRYVVTPEDERLVYGAARGMISSLDAHSRIYDDGEWAQNSLRNAGKYAGIGIVIGKLRGHLSVLEAVRRGPAARAGVRHGDRILAIDGADVDDALSLSEFGRRLRGKVGTKVRLRVAALDTTTERDLVIKRGLAPERLAYGYALESDPHVGYIHVEAFRETTIDQFDEEVTALLSQGVSSLVVDLRGNLGGSFDAAVSLVDRFIGGGLIVTTQGRTPSRPRHATRHTPLATIPLIVLVDGYSASASEIVAGALQDHARGVLVGERTFGKGVVQEVSAFRSGWPGGLKLTTAHYFTPAGRSIERSIGIGRETRRRGGILPDVLVPMTPRFSSDAARQDWYSRLGVYRQRGRYAPRVRRILRDQDDATFDDLQLDAARTLLAGEWDGDRRLGE